MGLIAHGTHRARCPRGATGRPVRPIPRAPVPRCPGLHDKPARRPRPVPSCERGRPPSGPRDGLRYTRGCVGAASGAGFRIRREPSSRRGPPAAHTWKGRGRCGGRGPDAAAEPRAAPLGRVPCAGGRGRGLSASHGAGGVDAQRISLSGVCVASLVITFAARRHEPMPPVGLNEPPREMRAHQLPSFPAMAVATTVIEHSFPGSHPGDRFALSLD